jgi:hypothetical protein
LPGFRAVGRGPWRGGVGAIILEDAGAVTGLMDDVGLEP